MLVLKFLGNELFDEETSTFITVGGTTLELEHSLVSLSKWESKHKVPFLSPKDKTTEQVIDYIKFMILNEDYDESIINHLTQEHLTQINAYIDSPESATTFGNSRQQGGRSETITSELIYYWMIAFNIPFECQHWHLNRLFSLIRICNIKNSKPTKMSQKEVAARNRELNAQRKAALNTSG